MPGRASGKLTTGGKAEEGTLTLKPPPSASMSHNDEDSVSAQLSALDLGNLYGCIDKQK